MEEEMRKIEEEFAFQEKWIEIFKRGKFFFQNIPEHLILKIITKLEAKDFLKILMTGKWMLLLCEENRGQLLIRLSDNYFYNRASISQKEKEAQIIKNVKKLLNSKYYFYFQDRINFDERKGDKDINFKETLINQLRKYSRKLVEKRYWRTAVVSCPFWSLNTTSVDFLQPVCLRIDKNGPIPEEFSLVSKNVKRLRIFSNPTSDSNFNERTCFGHSLPRIEFSNYDVVSLLAEITKEKHSNKEVEYLTFLRTWEAKIINSWPKFSFPSRWNEMGYPTKKNSTFYWVIVSKSEVGVVAIFIFWRKPEGQDRYSISLEWIRSLAEWKQFEGKQTFYSFAEMDKQLYMEFKDQVANKFFENGRVIYPEPAPEFVEFLKKFEDFDIEPEKLAPHKPKWKKTEKLPDLPRKLPEIHSNNWLIEAKEVIKLRKFWMDFLQKGKFILELMPFKNVLDIAKRIEPKRFLLLFSSTKWVNELIQSSASNFRIHGGRFCFSMNKIYRDRSAFKIALKSLEFYYLDDISFDYFNENINGLKTALQWVREWKIFVRRITLNRCPLIQELFESFARGPESLLVSEYTTLSVPVNFPPQLKEIEVDVKYFNEDRTKKLIERFTGIEQAVIWLCCDGHNTNETITLLLGTLKSKKCRSNILIRSWNTRHPFIINYDFQFDLSQISETVFIFRSMARGRGGVWNYFIRLEKAGSRAVGIAYYIDSIQVEEDCFSRFNIRCEYFPTMESFSDYFEREVGSKRRARDWMQLRKKDETIEPKKEDFNDYKIQKPYIHFNEQKEADDLKEVRRRFFS